MHLRSIKTHHNRIRFLGIFEKGPLIKGPLNILNGILFLPKFTSIVTSVMTNFEIYEILDLVFSGPGKEVPCGFRYRSTSSSPTMECKDAG
eukprot:SAG11_NODE_522_length_8776_cov_6.087242_2_plen_91_part_00